MAVKITEIKNAEGKVVKLKVQTIFDDPHKGQQQFKKDCDLKSMMKKYVKTGQIAVSSVKAVYGDFSNELDFQDAQNKLARYTEKFMAQPAAIRAKFNNNPGEMAEFLSKKENLPEARELGLIPKLIPVQDQYGLIKEWIDPLDQSTVPNNEYASELAIIEAKINPTT